MIDKLESHASIEWNLSGEPFLTRHGTLTTAVDKVIKQQMGISADLSTGGGTSDGRFIAKLGCELVELGPVNRSIHKSMKKSNLRLICTLRICTGACCES